MHMSSYVVWKTLDCDWRHVCTLVWGQIVKCIIHAHNMAIHGIIVHMTWQEVTHVGYAKGMAMG